MSTRKDTNSTEGKKKAIASFARKGLLCFTQACDAIIRTSEENDSENDALKALTLFKDLARENEHVDPDVLKHLFVYFQEARIDVNGNTLLLRAVDKSMIVFVQAFIEYFQARRILVPYERLRKLCSDAGSISPVLADRRISVQFHERIRPR